ncbi:hypothetical protein D3C71_2082770 [compost metagenome]
MDLRAGDGSPPDVGAIHTAGLGDADYFPVYRLSNSVFRLAGQQEHVYPDSKLAAADREAPVLVGAE